MDFPLALYSPAADETLDPRDPPDLLCAARAALRDDAGNRCSGLAWTLSADEPGDLAVVIGGRSGRRRGRTNRLEWSTVRDELPAVLTYGTVPDAASLRFLASGIDFPALVGLTDLDALCEFGSRVGALRIHEHPHDRSGTAAERHAARLYETGVEGVALPHSEWSSGLVALYHRFGVRTVATGATEGRHLRSLLLMGIDVVVSGRADRLGATFGEWANPTDANR